MIRRFQSYRDKVNCRLETLFSNSPSYAALNEAMKYSLLAGGKRIRPVLVLSFADAVGDAPEGILDAACSVELLHTYSLIHDDLPCMDNDELRRGKPTNHIVFGETTATLAGDALQAEAFDLLLNSKIPFENLVPMGRSLALAAGLDGICGGQALDIAAEGKKLSEKELLAIHSKKTAALLVACAKMGVYAAGGSEEQLHAAEEYANNIGLAFQIRDDILDVISTEQQLGKPIGSDSKNEKHTFVDLYGIECAQKMIEEKTELAVQSLNGLFRDTEFLSFLAKMLAGREY